MATIWTKEFTGGLDARRLPETTTGGVLLKATDGHITSGGEFEKRAAFVPVYQLPAGTTGLASPVAGLAVYGSADLSGQTFPQGVTYKRLQGSTGSPLARILSFDLYKGLDYVVAEFADGTREHFYNGVRVDGWFDGRGRAAFTVQGGAKQSAQAATATFALGGPATGTRSVDSLQVNGVGIIGGPVAFTTTYAQLAADLAAAINSYSSSPDYTATASGANVTVSSVAQSSVPNGYALYATATGGVTLTGQTSMSGGQDAVTAALTRLAVNGVPIISAPVAFTGDVVTTAQAIAAAVNATASTPDYTATVSGAQVTILCPTAQASDNGLPVAFGTSGGLALDPATGLTVTGATDQGGTFQPGTFVRTIGSKEYSVSGPNCHFSGVQEPTKWTTDTTGAGFIDMSTQASGSENLTALAKYQKYVAVFAGRTVQIWYMDPDPSQNQQVQVLFNTGTFAPRSLTQFSDADLFYLDESGLRSLRARDASNAASTTDVGSPIDNLLTAKLRTMSLDDRQKIIGAIDPPSGRFWLAVVDTIFVFSFFSGANVSAWTQYLPGFDVHDMVVYGQHLYLRSGDTIYAYGGLDAEQQFDETRAVAWLPFMDAGEPTGAKTIRGLDAACAGTWEFRVGMDPTNPNTDEIVSRADGTTYNGPDTPAQGSSTHFSVRALSQGNGPAKLGAIVLTFEDAK